MRRGTARRALAPVGLAMLMIAGIAGPALACDPRLADLHDSRSYPDAASAVEPASAPAPVVDATTRAISTITPGTVNRSSVVGVMLLVDAPESWLSSITPKIGRAHV